MNDRQLVTRYAGFIGYSTYNICMHCCSFHDTHFACVVVSRLISTFSTFAVWWIFVFSFRYFWNGKVLCQSLFPCLLLLCTFIHLSELRRPVHPILYTTKYIHSRAHPPTQIRQMYANKTVPAFYQHLKREQLMISVEFRPNENIYICIWCVCRGYYKRAITKTENLRNLCYASCAIFVSYFFGSLIWLTSCDFVFINVSMNDNNNGNNKEQKTI